jgi:hypothetical protein
MLDTPMIIANFLELICGDDHPYITRYVLRCERFARSDPGSPVPAPAGRRFTWMAGANRQGAALLCSYPQTNAAIERLVSAGILVQVTVGRRNRAFETRKLPTHSLTSNASSPARTEIPAPQRPYAQCHPRRPRSALGLRIRLNKK